jgi:hypothetical protein
MYIHVSLFQAAILVMLQHPDIATLLFLLQRYVTYTTCTVLTFLILTEILNCKTLY